MTTADTIQALIAVSGFLLVVIGFLTYQFNKKERGKPPQNVEVHVNLPETAASPKVDKEFVEYIVKLFLTQVKIFRAVYYLLLSVVAIAGTVVLEAFLISPNDPSKHPSDLMFMVVFAPIVAFGAGVYFLWEKHSPALWAISARKISFALRDSRLNNVSANMILVALGKADSNPGVVAMASSYMQHELARRAQQQTSRR